MKTDAVTASYAPASFVDTVMEAIAGVLPAERPLALHAPLFVGNEWEYVKSCLDTGWVSTAGDFVDRFEQSLCRYTGSRFAVATVNGTAALHIALKLSGVGTGDEVLVPDLTFVGTANAVVHAGAIPHFVDVAECSLGVDPGKLSAYLRDTTEFSGGALINRLTGRRIAALIAMHTFGHPCEIEALADLAQEFQLQLVEDAAESLGSFHGGRHTGLWGKLSILSFNGNKTITTGGGGMILTQDEELARRARHITTTAKQPHPWEFFHDEVGYNYRLPNLNAALGCAQMEMLDQFLERKRNLFARYERAFASFDGLRLMRERAGTRANYWLNALLLDKGNASFSEQIITATNRQGIQTRPAWNLMHTLPMFAASPCMPVETAIQIAARVICLPSSPSL